MVLAFQQEMHPHAEDSMTCRHPQSSKQYWEAGKNLPCWKVLLKELGHVYPSTVTLECLLRNDCAIFIFTCVHYIYQLQYITHVAFRGLGRIANPNCRQEAGNATMRRCIYN